ncbi:PKD2 [Branchiostoma lanceolatum]|uniref:PKD2 protein n=1 Tax=Branchiostoma lanceolatum TaxID=7740 RepID=A0A8J9YSA5_BRALA|nr:PKD2 [Branchiostoma lanceolatum]
MERVSQMSIANLKEARQKHSRERKIENVLWGILRFCVFLLLIVTITNNQHNTTTAFHQTQSAADSFVDSTDDVTDASALLSWLDETALESFYPETSYNGDKPRWWEKGFTTDMQSVLVFPPSLIQARVRPGLCTVPAAMQYLFDECTTAYDENTKETGAFEKGWKRVTNMSKVELEATEWSHRSKGYTIKPIFGVKSHYWGDGFSLDLGKSADEMRSILAELKANRWIDRRTRAVILEALLYNGNLDLFTSVTMAFEFSEMSGVFSHRHLHTFRLHQRPGTIGYINVLLEIIYVIVLLYSLWKEVKAARAAGLAYLKEPWNIVEIFNFILAFTVIALYGSNRGYSSKALMAVQQGKDPLQFLKLLVNINLMYGWFLSFLAFVNIMKLLRLLRFDPFLAKLMSVFRGMAAEFSAFILYFFLCFSGFGISAYLMFGATVTAYRSISLSYSTLFQMSLGLFDYTELFAANPILGPIFFVTFMCLIFLVLMNIAMAIIDSALPDVRNHVMSEEDSFFIQGIWERFTALLGRQQVQVQVTGDDSMDRLQDSLIEVEIKVEGLWLKRRSFFLCRRVRFPVRSMEWVKDSELPTVPDFVPPVKEVSKDADEELPATRADLPVIVIRPASRNTLTDTTGGPASQNTLTDTTGGPASRNTLTDTTGGPASQNTLTDTTGGPASRNTLTDTTGGPASRNTLTDTTGGPASRNTLTDTTGEPSRNTLTDTTGQNIEEVETVPSEVRVVTHIEKETGVEDKMVLTAGKALTYNHFRVALSLLRRQYPALQGLEDPVIGLYEVGFAKMTGKGLQIHHSVNMHWVLSSYTGGQVCLFDSLGVTMTKSLQIQLCQSYATFADRETSVLTVLSPGVQNQWNDNDCGLFVIAWAVDIAEGRDVRGVVYDDRKMRSHLEMCFKQGNLAPFPRLTHRRSRVGPVNAQRISLICQCEQGGRLGRMERCKTCRRIFHVSCLAVSPPRGDTWACSDCNM